MEALAASLSPIGEVRGLGAMLALELVRDRQSREPASALAATVVARACEKGLILNMQRWWLCRRR